MSSPAQAQKLDRSSLALVLLFGVAGTIQYHAMQFFSGFDRFFGDRGDARGFLYYCEHWFRSLSGKASLLSPGVFYPAKGTLAYSDLLLGVAAPYSLFRALGFDMFSSLEIVIILTAFLSYCAAFWLLYKTLGFGLAPSIVGAMFFAFNSPKFFQTIHLQLQFVLLLPLLFALLITFAKQVQTLDQRRAAILLSLAAVIFDLQMATGFYFAWFFTLWTTFFLLLALAFTRSRRFIFAVCKKFWPAMSVAAGVLLLGFVPILLFYLPQARPENWYRYEALIELIPDWRSLLSMGAGNYLWGGVTMALLPDPIPSTWGELQVGIGIFSSLTWIALIVATVWFIRVRRETASPNAASSSSIPDPRQLALLFLAILIFSTTLFYLIGFRYEGYSPWHYVYRFFPGGRAIRGVARYVIFLALPMSIAFAFVVDRGLKYASRQSSELRRKVLMTVVLVLGGLIVFEQFGVAKIGGGGFSIKIEKAYLNTLAAKLPANCEAFYIAAGPLASRTMPEYQYDAMLLSLITEKPTLNASSSQFPPGWDLYTLTVPDYEEKVKSWVTLQKIAGPVCRLETGPEITAFDKSYPNPIDDPEFFVRQLYRDFTGEEPAKETIAPQVEKLRNCNRNDESCGKEWTALNLFLSTGYYERGFLILQMYQAGLGRLPHYDEFTDMMKRFSDNLKTESSHDAIARMFAEFSAANKNVSTASEENLRKVIGSDEFVRQMQNRSFVTLHYFAFMRREPDEVGLRSWTDLLNRRGDAAMITDGFITSAEYRVRSEINRLNSTRLNGSH
jgi:Domain of unknown function (DUF4214)